VYGIQSILADMNGERTGYRTALHGVHAAAA